MSQAMMKPVASRLLAWCILLVMARCYNLPQDYKYTSAKMARSETFTKATVDPADMS